MRDTGYKDDWRHKRFEGSPVGKHFCSSGYDFIKHASVCCLEKIKEEEKKFRWQWNSVYIQQLFIMCNVYFSLPLK